MNILIVGIPVSDLVALILERDPDAKLWVAESRPFEAAVSREISRLQEEGVTVTLVTDNSISALYDDTDISMVWSLFTRKQGDRVETINGALTAALLADLEGIPFGLYQVDNLPVMPPARFGTGTIHVEGAAYIEHMLDTVPLNLAAEVIDIHQPKNYFKA